MIRRRARLLVPVSALGWACSPPPQPAAPPATVVAAPKPPPERARWVFAGLNAGVGAKLDLGDGSTLYVSSNGRRERARGDGPLVEAPTLALTDLLGVLRDDKGRFVFLGASGQVFKADEPLGPLSAPTPAVMKLTNRNWWTTGRAALVGVDPADGRVLRSGDYGATWQTVAYPGSTAYGKARAVELDPQGNGILLRLPQRVLVTHDDGVTWSEVATPGIGGKSVLRDGADHLYLQGRTTTETPRARLLGSKLVVTKEEPIPLIPSSEAFEGKCGDADSGSTHRTVLSGDRVLDFAEVHRSGKTGISLAAGPIATGVGEPVLRAELGAPPLSAHIAGYGSDIVYLGHEEGENPARPTTTVFRSADYGATWHREATLEGVDTPADGGVDVVVGPGGFTYVTTLCGRSSPEGRVCAHRQIRPSGTGTFEDMEFDEEMTPLSFAFDEAHDRVYALGVHNAMVQAYESQLSKNHFVRTDLLEVPAGRSIGMSVDDAGVVRALAYDRERQAWSVHQRAATGGAATTTWLALSDGTLAFAGAHGLIFSATGEGWETADGGQTWIATGTGGSVRDLSCTVAGCLTAGARRIGWDLPAVQDEKRVTAGDLPAAASAPSVLSATLAPITELACKPALAPTAIAQIPGDEMMDNRSGDLRWASVRRSKDSEIAIVFGTRTAVRETVLLAALPKPKAADSRLLHTKIRSGARVLNDGVVAARYHAIEDDQGQPQSIDVDLAWWSASTGRTTRHTLTKQKPFYLSPDGDFSGTPQIVDGGLLFQAAGNTTFVHDDGRVEPLSLPSGVGVGNAERIGKQWVVADSLNGTVQLSWSRDGGKLWSQKDWGLGATGYSLVVLLDGKPTLTFSEVTSTAPSALFAIADDVPDDPPAPVVIDTSTVDAPCDAHAGALRLSTEVASSPYRFRARIAASADPSRIVAVSGEQRVTHVRANGKICTSAYSMRGFDGNSHSWQTAFLYPEAKGWRGWWFRPNPNAKDPAMTALAEPITCEVAAAPPR